MTIFTYRFKKTLHVRMNDKNGVQYIIDSTQEPPVKRYEFDTKAEFDRQHELVKNLCGKPTKMR